MNNAGKRRDYFYLFSWIFLILVFIGLVAYLCVHIRDLLDSDMASEMILSKLLKENGGILSSNWYYSTEIRIINTQVFYSLFFHLFDDWQTVRIFGNISLYLLLLSSYFFLCKRLKIERYFPVSAGIMFLPLSGPYFYILLYGAFYIPRISLMFIILGLLVSIVESSNRTITTVFMALTVSALSLALGLEGGRMLLVLFFPIAVVVGFETVYRFFARENSVSITLKERSARLKQSGFPRYFSLAFVACMLAVVGYIINQKVLAVRYPFEHYVELVPKQLLVGMKDSIYAQMYLIGHSKPTYVLSILIWASIVLLFARSLFRNGAKSLRDNRFIGFCIASWACYMTFNSLFTFGQVAWHMVPVAVLFIPGTVVAIKQAQLPQLLRRILFVGIALCLMTVSIQGFLSFKHWPIRDGLRCDDSYGEIADVLEEQHYKNGYATFLCASVLTELSDGYIDVWSVNAFDKNTTKNPNTYKWLQERTHDNTLPSGKTFLLWTRDEYNYYSNFKFEYLGEKIFESDDYIVFEVKQ